MAQNHGKQTAIAECGNYNYIDENRQILNIQEVMDICIQTVENCVEFVKGFAFSCITFSAFLRKATKTFTRGQTYIASQCLYKGKISWHCLYNECREIHNV